MLNPAKINKLNQYSYNRTLENETKNIEQKLLVDATFKEEAEVFFNLFNGFKALEKEKFQEKLKNWELKHTQISTHTSRNISKMTNLSKYAVAAILLLSFLPLGYQFLNQKMSTEEVFAANFSTEKILDLKNQRSAEEKDPSKIKTLEDTKIAKDLLTRSKAIASYNGKNYPEAINLFKSYLASDTKIKNKSEIELYLAKAYLADNKPFEANQLLTTIIKEGKKSTKQDAEWYLVLTLIKQDNVEQAKKELNKILLSPITHAHKDKALKLQQQIDKYLVQ